MKTKFCRIALTGILAMGVALCSAPTFAQGGGRMDPAAQLAQMTTQYTLTADQQSKIKPILEDRQKQMQALFQDQSGDRSTMMTKMMAIRKDTNSKIRAILTPEQQTKFDAEQKAMQERMQQRMGGGGGGPQ